MPIQAGLSRVTQGTAEILDDYVPGLKDLDGFSHVILLYHFDRVTQTRLEVIPYLDEEYRGVFATRAPVRPNHIGMAVVELERIEGNVLHFRGADMLDGTPLLDIKPYVGEFDAPAVERIGWLAEARQRMPDKRADDRFE